MCSWPLYGSKKGFIILTVTKVAILSSSTNTLDNKTQKLLHFNAVACETWINKGVKGPVISVLVGVGSIAYRCAPISSISESVDCCVARLDAGKSLSNHFMSLTRVLQVLNRRCGDPSLAPRKWRQSLRQMMMTGRLTLILWWVVSLSPSSFLCYCSNWHLEAKIVDRSYKKGSMDKLQWVCKICNKTDTV